MVRGELRAVRAVVLVCQEPCVQVHRHTHGKAARRALAVRFRRRDFPTLADGIGASFAEKWIVSSSFTKLYTLYPPTWFDSGRLL